MRTSNKIFENSGYQINRENRCCRCGKDNNLTRHHLIPACFINKLDKGIKDELKKIHVFYYEWDYCCLCGDCHKEYEVRFGDGLIRYIWKMYNVNLKYTSYKQNHSNLPKPSKVVSDQIKTAEDYLHLRKLCTEFFVKNMKPKFSLI